MPRGTGVEACRRLKGWLLSYRRGHADRDHERLTAQLAQGATPEQHQALLEVPLSGLVSSIVEPLQCAALVALVQ